MRNSAFTEVNRLFCAIVTFPKEKVSVYSNLIFNYSATNGMQIEVVQDVVACPHRPIERARGNQVIVDGIGWCIIGDMVFGTLTTHRAVRAAAAALLACALAFASGCGGSQGSGGGGGATSSPTGAAFAAPDAVTIPEVPEEGMEIDTSHMAQGYVVVRESSPSRLKFQVSKGEMVYNYDLPNDGSPTVYPVNMGDGNYLLRIMRNTDGNNYVEIASAEESITLESEYAPFLIPNQFCNYDEQSACVAKARELTAGASNQGEAVRSVCEYIVDNVTYDSDKAKVLTTTTGYVPNPDETLATGKGVCFDYASLGAAMLRSMGFPTKIITGYVSPGDLYHAWIMIYVDGSWKTGEFSVNPDSWSRVDLTFAASGSSEFTGDGTSYTERYVY